MQKHIKNYLKHFKIGEDDIWFCEVCKRSLPINNGLQLHHIVFRSHCGGDEVENCMSLCVSCHVAAHTNISKKAMQKIHDDFMKNNSR